MRPSLETYTQVFGTVYLALVTNLLLVLSGLPFVLVLVTTDPARSWPLLAVLAPVCAPGVVAAFTVFARHAADGTTSVVRTFVRAWRVAFRTAACIGATVSAALVVLGVDVRALAPSRAGALAVPALVVLVVLSVATGLLALVAAAERPTARTRDLLRASIYLAARRWYLTVVSLGALGLLGALLAAKPALALGLALTPLLYVAWANSRFALAPVLQVGDQTSGAA
jgi:uncharacterized membrane protein YesL